MIPESIILRSKPLFLDETGSLVLGKGNSLFRRTDGEKLQLLVSVPESPIMQLIACNRWIMRILRLGFGCGACFRDIYYFTYNAKVYSFDPKNGQLRDEFSFASGRGPLSFTVVENIPGFEDGIYFGEYINNPNRNPVKIYKRDESGAWNTVFTFPSKEINHLHSLVVDRYRNCVWLLAGDFEHSASIWIAKENFKEVTNVVANQQIYRACVAFPLPEGLLYATDSQMTTNSLRLLSYNNKIWTSDHLLDINGSCIYGCHLQDYFVFSTSTEPSDMTAATFFSLLDCKPGPGIIMNKSDVIIVRKSDLATSILFTKNKDYLPYRLFQFGSIFFPYGAEHSNTLYCYSIGNFENDLSTEVYNLDRNFQIGQSLGILHVRD